MILFVEEFETFLDNYPTKTYEPGEIIVHQGDAVQTSYAIRSGLIKVYDIGKEGDQKLIVYDGKYEVFPIVATYARGNKSWYYYEAFLKTKISIVPREEYLDFINHHPKSMNLMFQMMVDRYLDFSRRVNSLTQLKAEDKILYSLDFLCRRFGDRQNLSRVKILIPMSQQEMANFVGLTRETVSTTMSKLRKKGIIKYKGMHGIEVNVHKVEEALSW